MFGELAVLREGFRIQRRVIWSLILREMSTKFGKSSFGYLWALAMPVALIMIKTTLFSFIGRNPDIGQSFTLFFATALVPFMMYSKVTGGVGKAIKGNQGLLSYPHVKLLDVFTARAMLEMATMFVAAMIIVVMLMLENVDYEIRSVLELVFFLSVVMAFSTGLGMVNAHIFEYIPSYEQFFSMLSMPLLLLSGIFYIADNLPIMVRDILVWNPLLQFSEWSRSIFYPGFDSSHVDVFYLVCWAYILLFLGLALNKLNEGRQFG